MELENECEAFCADLITEKPVVQQKIDDEKRSGWISLMAEFNVVYEDLAKKSSLLNQKAEEMLHKLEVVM